VTAEDVTIAALLSPTNEVGAPVGSARELSSEIGGILSESLALRVALADGMAPSVTVVVLPEGRGRRLPLRWHASRPGLDAGEEVTRPDSPAEADEGSMEAEADSLADGARSCRAAIAGAAMDWVAARASTEKSAASIVGFG
jgi:hypothetical protein